eukprot:1438596-Amphidinium_carterae.1
MSATTCGQDPVRLVGSLLRMSVFLHFSIIPVHCAGGKRCTQLTSVVNSWWIGYLLSMPCIRHASKMASPIASR